MAVVDRRIQRTRDTLHSALMSLVVEVPYDTITVQQILDRANVGRSTFYTHFQDKDELLIWGTEHLRQTLAAAQQQPGSSPENLIQFSRAMFEHADRYRKIYRALVNSPVWPHVRQRIQNIIADLLRRQTASLKGRETRVPLELLIHYIASTLMTVMTWWVDRRSNLSVDEIDEVYRSLVMPSIRSSLG